MSTERDTRPISSLLATIGNALMGASNGRVEPSDGTCTGQPSLLALALPPGRGTIDEPTMNEVCLSMNCGGAASLTLGLFAAITLRMFGRISD